MKLLQKTRYALLAVVYIALHQNKGTTDAISKKYHLSFGFLQNIMTQLIKAQITISNRSGGTILAKKPNKTTLLEIIEATEGSAIKSLVLLEGISDERWFKKMKEVCKKAVIRQSKILSETTLADMIKK